MLLAFFFLQDREARIRTQQLQMQVYSMHAMIMEMQSRIPNMTFTATPTGLPEHLQNPWGTGRDGPGTGMRSGVGVSAVATSEYK